MHSTPVFHARPPLRRDRDCAVSGTAAGLARHLGWSVLLVRALFVVLTLASGAGVVLYAWIWVFTPQEDGAERASRRVPVAWILAGLSAAGLLVNISVFVSAQGRPSSLVDSGGLGPVAASALLAVAAGLWATFIDRDDPARGPRHEFAVRAVVTAILTALLVLQMFNMQRDGLSAFLMAIALLVCIAAVFSSSLVAKWRALSGERVRRIREEQRSEMAAHLHDSVMQTLALIQHKAGASSEVARLARAQERELRAWLYDADTPADSDLPTDLRDFAAALELDYPVRIDVVSTGVSMELASGELAAAAREAMLNAARHAAGEISVYIEGSATQVQVFVRDRGPGFDPDNVPADRWGVRESIIGRMRRAGGSAVVRPGTGGIGTEVHLTYAPELVEAQRG